MTHPAKDLGTAYLRALLLVSAFLVFTTLIFRYRTEYFLWLAPLSLGEENVVAAWFSGTLLLLAAFHASDGYFRLRNTHPKAAFAWCVIAGMLLFLSADEIACLHERIEHLKPGPVLSFVPFVIALLGGCLWSFRQLWVTPSERSQVAGLVLGFALLASVGGQEVLERHMELPWYLRPVRTAIEEGTELGGILVLIYTVIPNSLGLFSRANSSRASSQGSPAFSGIAGLRWPIALFTAAIAWPVAELTASMGEQAALGHLSDWMACALFTSSAALLVSSWALSESRDSFPWTAVVLLCAASALCVQFDPVGDHERFPASSAIRAFGLDLNTRLVLLTLCCLGTAETLRAKGRAYRVGSLLMVGVGVVAAACAAYSTPDALWWGYFASSAIAVGTFAALGAGVPLSRVIPAAQPAARGVP